MNLFRRLLNDQRGNVAVIVAFMLLPMVLIAGGAIDIARYEAYRSQLQDGVDRAVLASAALSQSKTVEETAGEYLKSIPYIGDVDLSYDYKLAFNARQVTITAHYDMETGFLPLIGVKSMPVEVKASAEEKRRNLEISMMLDMSGSMRWSTPAGAPSRISLLRPAAKSFIDLMLTNETKLTTSISIVPYAGSVNPGATIFNGLGTPRRHTYSSCINFLATDYQSVLVPFNQRGQTAHFTVNHQGVNEPGLEWSWCPYEATSISYLSNDASALKAKIDALRMHDGTGTAIAMKWGMMLLEPAAQPLVAQAAAAGLVPSQFSRRPAAFTDGETLKVLVLMTDGAISPQWEPKKYDYPRSPAVDNQSPANGGDPVQNMYAVCDRAKANGVIVFTIGFQVDNTAKTQMRNCASSPAHFYDVSGLDIAAAFKSIALAIQKIKLTQ